MSSARSWFLSLVSTVWGAYVAVAPEPSTAAWSVLRDPGGRAPCWFVDLCGWRIVFSHLEDVASLEGVRFHIDWTRAALFVQQPRIRDGGALLQGVCELMPGACVGAAGRPKQVWLPAAFTEDVVEDIGAGRSLLRASLLTAVSAAASSRQRILHLLSGGLDSSILLACLKEIGAAPKTTALHFTRGAGSELDESAYAAAAARHANVELIQRTLNPSAVDLRRAQDFTMAPRPMGYAYSIENDDLELETASAANADVCFSAAGGDGLFYQLRAKTFAADYLRRHGVGGRFLETALDSARLTRSSFWTIIQAARRYGIGAEFDPTAAPRNRYLHRDVVLSERSWLSAHPWFEDATGLCPGKRLHLWAVLDCLNLDYRYRRDEIAPTCLPFVAQPVIETVLRIPSYVHCRGGGDRTLLREAFAGMAPQENLQRRSKGSMDNYYAEVACANAPFLRERLLDGVLCREGLIDRGAIERDMPGNREPGDGAEADLLRLFGLETWAARWAAP